MISSSHPRDERYETWRRRIFAVTWIAYVGFYFTRSSFPVAKIAIAEDPAIQLTHQQMGLIDGGYLAAYAVGQFIWGALGDRCGTRAVVLAGLAASAFATLAMGMSSTVLWFAAFSVLQGLSQSTGWAPLTKTVGAWFALRERGTIMGWWATNYAVGSLAAAPFAGWLAEHYGDWRMAFLGPALVLVGVLLLFFVLQRNDPADEGLPPVEVYKSGTTPTGNIGPAESPPKHSSWDSIGLVIRSPIILLLGFVYFLLKPTRYAILFWGPLYISERIDAGMAKSATINIAFFLAGPVSVVMAGFITDRWLQSRRLPYCAVSLLLLGVVLYFFDAITGSHNEVLIVGTLFTMGMLLFGPDSLISGTAAVDFGAGKGASTAVGLVNGLGSVGAVVGGTIPGLMRESWGWSGIFTFLSVCSAVAGVALLLQWNARPVASNDAPIETPEKKAQPGNAVSSETAK